MNYDFLPQARDELWEAALFYENREAGLGLRFRREVAHVVERILADPYLWRQRFTVNGLQNDPPGLGVGFQARSARPSEIVPGQQPLS